MLEQMEARGLKIRGVVLDSGFDSGETLLLLQERKFSYIETSYRQMNEAKAKTTKKDVAYRLLLIGLALLLRQVWVWLTRQVAQDRGMDPTQKVHELPLPVMTEWLADLLEGKYKEKKEIRLEIPLLRLAVA